MDWQNPNGENFYLISQELLRKIICLFREMPGCQDKRGERLEMTEGGVS